MVERDFDGMVRGGVRIGRVEREDEMGGNVVGGC